MADVGDFRGTIDEARAIARAFLLEHSIAAGHPHGEEAVVLAATDAGRTVGVLVGRIVYGWLLIDLLAVDPGHRRRSVGTRLIALAEEAARAHDCEGMQVDTSDFQAPGFYHRLGFEEMGVVPNRVAGRTRRYFLKRLAPPG